MKKIIAGLFLFLCLFQRAGFAETPAPAASPSAFAAATAPKPVSHSTVIAAGKGVGDLISRVFVTAYDLAFRALRKMDIA